MGKIKKKTLTMLVSSASDDKLKLLRRRRQNLVNALARAGVDPTRPDQMLLAGSGYIVGVSFHGQKKTRFFLTLRGLQQLAAHHGVQVPA